MDMPKTLSSDRERELDLKTKIVCGIMDAGHAEIPDDLLNCDSGVLRAEVAPAIHDALIAGDSMIPPRPANGNRPIIVPI